MRPELHRLNKINQDMTSEHCGVLYVPNINLDANAAIRPSLFLFNVGMDQAWCTDLRQSTHGITKFIIYIKIIIINSHVSLSLIDGYASLHYKSQQALSKEQVSFFFSSIFWRSDNCKLISASRDENQQKVIKQQHTESSLYHLPYQREDWPKG